MPSLNTGSTQSCCVGRVNKGTKRMNSSTLSPLVISSHLIVISSIFTRISKFRCFHEKWGRKIVLQLGRTFFRIFLRQSENFSEFCKVWSQFAFRNIIVPLPKSQTRHPARARASLTLPHSFLTKTVLQNPSLAPIYYRGISLKRFRY